MDIEKTDKFFRSLPPHDIRRTAGTNFHESGVLPFSIYNRGCTVRMIDASQTKDSDVI